MGIDVVGQHSPTLGLRQSMTDCKGNNQANSIMKHKSNDTNKIQI